MPDPVNYTQTKNLVTPVATAETNLNTALDAEVTKIGTSLNGAVNAIKDLRAADGTLKPATVGAAQLKPEIKFAYVNRGNWAASVAYAINDCVFYNSKAYACRVAHTSVAAQTPDKIPANWTLVADIGNMAANALVPNANAGTVQRPISDRINERMSVKDFGAVGDGVADDTAALQAAFNWVTDPNFNYTDGIYKPARKLYVPSGIYKTTATLYLSYGMALIVGLTIEGDGRGASIIKCFTDDIPIVQIEGWGHHSWEICHLGFDYAREQTNKESVCLMFRSRNNYGCGLYNSSFHNLMFSNAFYALANYDNKLQHFWGNRLHDIQCFELFGGFYYLKTQGGHPSNRLDSFHINSARMVGPVFHSSYQNWQFGTIELNNVCNLGGPGGMPGSVENEFGIKTLIIDDPTGTYDISYFHLEYGEIKANSTLFHVRYGNFRAERIGLFDIKMKEGITVLGFDLTACRDSAIASVATNNISTDQGTLILYNYAWPRGEGASYVNIGRMRISTLDQCVLDPNVYLCYWDKDIAPHGAYGTDHLLIEKWNDPAIENFPGDADLVLGPSSDHTQTFRTLTANRTVTLPPSYKTVAGVGRLTNLFSGRRFKIVKRTTSNFTLTIKDSTNTVIATLPAGQKAWIDVVWNRGDTPTEWQVIGQGTF